MKYKRKKTYYVYILRCNDQTYYTGITTDLKRRVREHNTGKKGARYTSTRRPVICVYREKQPDRSAATIREREIKKYPRKKKQKLIQPLGGNLRNRGLYRG